MKILSLNELRDSGLLQEVNRQWFHPLGLALGVTIDGDSSKLELLDARDDPEGFIFDDGVMDQDKCERFRSFVEQRHQIRKRALGFIVQPPIC